MGFMMFFFKQSEFIPSLIPFFIIGILVFSLLEEIIFRFVLLDFVLLNKLPKIIEKNQNIILGKKWIVTSLIIQSLVFASLHHRKFWA